MKIEPEDAFRALVAMAAKGIQSRETVRGLGCLHEAAEARRNAKIAARLFGAECIRSLYNERIRAGCTVSQAQLDKMLKAEGIHGP